MVTIFTAPACVALAYLSDSHFIFYSISQALVTHKNFSWICIVIFLSVMALTLHKALFRCFVSFYCPLQVKAEISVDSKHQTLQGLAFPLQETAKRALHQLSQKRINYIQLVSLMALELVFPPEILQ